jgi:hypothetical protein
MYMLMSRLAISTRTDCATLLRPPRHTVGTKTWDQFLAARLQEQRSDLHPASRVNGG